MTSGPVEKGGQWRHVSTVFWEFSAISKIVRHNSVGQIVQKLQAAIILTPCRPLLVLKGFKVCLSILNIDGTGVVIVFFVTISQIMD